MTLKHAAINVTNYMSLDLTPVDTVRNLGIILDWIKIFLFLHTSHLNIPNPASSIFYGEFDFFWIALYRVQYIAIASSLIHSKINYTATLFCSIYFPAAQINRLQLVLNSDAHAVT
jgi:hypothetical protein